MKLYLLVATLLLILKSCCLASDFRKILDLTWNFDNDTIYWTGVQPFVYTKRVESDERGYWYSGNEFCCGEHGGTHLDAPYHFYRYGWKVGGIPVERLIGKGALLDMRKESRDATNITNLEVKHLEKWEKENGPFENGTILLVKFGRSEFWLNSTKYFEMDCQKNFNFPGISQAAAEWLVKTDRFFGVGLDTPSIDPGRSTDFIAHRILNGKQLYALENVKLTEELPRKWPQTKGFTLLVMPMKLREGSGAPVRIVAVPKKIV